MTTKYANNFEVTLPFSDTGVQMQLAASTALSWTVPGTANQIYRANFKCSSTAEIWVCLNGTATLPTSGVASATYNQEFIPLNEARYVKGGDTLSFISAGTPMVGVSLLQVQDIT